MIRAVFWIFIVGFTGGGFLGYYGPKAVGWAVFGAIAFGIVMEIGVVVRKIETDGFYKWFTGEDNDKS